MFYASGALGATLSDSLTVVFDLDDFAGTPVPREVADAVRHVCGLGAPGDSFRPLLVEELDDVAREYYASLAAKQSDLATMFVAYFSGFFHELRHAHDLLGSTFGQQALAMNFNYYRYVPVLTARLADWQEAKKGRRIPFPLVRTLGEMPDVAEDVVALVRKYTATEERLRGFMSEGRDSLAGNTLVHLVEASATNAQLDFVHDVFGDEGVDRLIDLIASNQRSTVYLDMRNELAERFLQQFPRGIGLGTIMNYLVWCSLQMTTRQREPLEQGPAPVTLFEALIEHVLHHVRELDLGHVREAVDDFCRDWDFLTPADVTAQQRERLAGLAKRFTEQHAEFSWSGDRPVTVAYNAFTAAYDSITRRIEESPELYFAQRSYVWSTVAGLWPSIYVKARWDGEVHDRMTAGTPLIPFAEWDDVTVHAGMFRFLMRGPHRMGFFDDSFRKLLTEPPMSFKLVERTGG